MSTPRRHRADRSLIALAFLALAVSAPSHARQLEDAPARQVTLLGVIASPRDPFIDPKLEKFEPQLRKLLPGHGFRLLDVRSTRLTAGQSVSCDFRNGLTTSVTLVQPADDNGKVQLRCAVVRDRVVMMETHVSTPPNQLFFCDKELDGGERLLIGVGAR